VPVTHLLVLGLGPTASCFTLCILERWEVVSQVMFRAFSSSGYELNISLSMTCRWVRYHGFGILFDADFLDPLILCSIFLVAHSGRWVSNFTGVSSVFGWDFFSPRCFPLFLLGSLEHGICHRWCPRVLFSQCCSQCIWLVVYASGILRGHSPE
jgi:hypothetical protein